MTQGHLSIISRSRSNKLFLLGWLPRICIVTSLGKMMVDFFFFNFLRE